MIDSEVAERRAALRARVAVEAFDTSDPATATSVLRNLVQEGLLDLPSPGAGRTKDRFEALAALGEIDLTLARLAEAHTDALAILLDLPHDLPAVTHDDLWAVWAAEPPTAVLQAETSMDGRWVVDGRKAWCSGAGGSTHALVTAHAADGPRLFGVDLSLPGVRRLDDSWPVAALIGTDTRSVEFDRVPASPLGGPNAYVERPGFWHGSIGVAAVWHGGAVGVARALARVGAERGLSDINRVHLGAVWASLYASRASLETAAAECDADPHDDRREGVVVARSTRAVVEASAVEVIDRVGRALGPGPLALDREHARRVGDLQLYLRQSHAERDLAGLGADLLKKGLLL